MCSRSRRATWDEPICVPTHEARELATRTQQILAHEVGAARTADPLGGSWYVQGLTDQLEADALEMLRRIEDIGIVKAVQDGTIEQLMDEYNHTIQRELESGERIVVGVNRFVPDAEPPAQRFTVDRASIDAHVRRFVAMKAHRDTDLLARRLATLYEVAARGDNPHDAMIDALIANGTIAKVWGTDRAAHGYPYDPFRVLEPPFPYPS